MGSGPDVHTGDETGSVRRVTVRAIRRLLRWALPVVVFTGILGASSVASFVVRDVVRDQDNRLLAERADEASAFLVQSMAPFTSTLEVLATFPRPEANVAQLAKGAPISVAGADDVVMAAVGDSPGVGKRLSDARVELARRSVPANDVVASVIREGGHQALVFARYVPRTGQVLFTEVPIDPSVPVNVDVFRDLEGVVYVAPRADSRAVGFATTTHLPLSSQRVERRAVKIGADTWHLEAAAKQPLVGSFAAGMYRLLLAGGAVVALLVCVLVEVLLRRRVYALRLVDQRTLELRSAREAADAANRSKSEFLSRMSHELRTPLNAVLGFAQLLDIDPLEPPQQESVDQILRGGRHLLDLINEVLEISSIETGNLTLSAEPVPAAEVITEVIDLTRALADNVGVAFLAESPTASGIHVLADRQRLKQVLLNLVSNAIKYNVPGGTVSIATRAAADGLLRIEVTDTGLGIDMAKFDRLFLPFERLGAEQTEVEGTGIGLALSRHLAEAMGGTVGVVSEPGRGSTFWIELPEAEGPVERFERLTGDVVPAGPVQLGSRRHKIVYIEDNLSNLRLVDRVLSRNDDVEVISSMQGGLGIELVREHQPTFVLLDLHLPDIPGEEVLRQLQQDPRTFSIPVVVVSADATTGQVERLLAGGARAYLTKPLDLPELTQLLDELMAASV